MIRSRGKLKKKRFDKLRALYRHEEKRLAFLGTIDYDDDDDFEDDEQYGSEEDEFEDVGELLSVEFFDFY